MKKSKKIPLKRSKSGLEVELFLLDHKGNPTAAADSVIKRVKSRDKTIQIVKECNKQWIELGSFPSIRVQDTYVSLLKNLRTTMEVADKMGMLLYPLASYPGKFEPALRKDMWYKFKKRIMGKDIFILAAKCTGFHMHYTLPRGVFDRDKGTLKRQAKSKIKDTLINSYNMAIAMDPALTTFLQSSPFFEGKYLAKDSRMLIYRGGRRLGFNGVHSNFQQLGALPPYKQTLTDLMLSLEKRFDRFKRSLEKRRLNINELAKSSNILNFAWNPVKINKLGTLETRGMDMNHPKYLMGASVLVKYVLRKIQQDFMKVVPSDIGIEQPFKVEGDIVYIPPHTYVRNTLQRLSAYKGLKNNNLYEYCKRFFRFAKQYSHKRYNNILADLNELLMKRETVSDMLIKKVKRKGYALDKELPKALCSELALDSAHQLSKEIDATLHRMESLN